jgi:hypothetical protein
MNDVAASTVMPRKIGDALKRKYLEPFSGAPALDRAPIRCVLREGGGGDYES